VLCCVVVSCLVLSYFVLSCQKDRRKARDVDYAISVGEQGVVLCCLVLSCLVVSCLVFSCVVLSGLVWSGLLSILCYALLSVDCDSLVVRCSCLQYQNEMKK
jgi:hypothetical protein